MSKKKYDGNKIIQRNIDGLNDYQILQVISNMFIMLNSTNKK